MSLEQLAQALPECAKDIKLNLSGMMRQTELTESQKWGSIVASALTCGKESPFVAGILEEAGSKLSEEELNGAKIAATIMAMNNIYYRFGHLSSNQKYLQSPSKLRMNSMRQHGADKNDFELWCLVVSAINGCGLCIDSHEKLLRENGISEETILASVRIGSILHAAFSVMEWSGKQA